MSTVIPIRELDTLIDPEKLSRMQDFQLGWFWKIFDSLRHAPHFRLPFDANFWALAGARTKGYWDNNKALVVACFKVQPIAGHTWIWHEGLVRLAEAGSQSQTDAATELFSESPQENAERDSLLDLFLTAYKNYPKHVSKSASEKKFITKAKKHARTQKIPLFDAAEFITQKCAEYAAATKRAGIHKQFIPNMARWLNEERYLDDPSEWAVTYQVTNGNGRTGAANVAGKTAMGQSGAREVKSLADPKCRTCQGSGFDLTSGKAARCGCWIANRQANAAATAGAAQ